MALATAVSVAHRTVRARGFQLSLEDYDALSRYMSAYWLRPENAMWMTLRHVALRAHPVIGPSADLSCGDGVFSFLHAGGALADSFDVFSSVGHLDRVTGQHADMFDVHDADYSPLVTRQPDWSYDVGADLKTSMLEKAAKLHFYSAHVQADNNLPLPFENECFQTVHCNAAYWVREIDLFLRELRRITRASGTILLHVKLAAMSDYTLESRRAALGARVLDILGRGRLACWPTVASRSEWERRFARAGLAVQDAEPLATASHARIWDIGLRPIAPLLVRMAGALTPENRASIKRDWVDLFVDLAEPLCDAELALTGDEGEPAEIQYVLRRL